MLFAATWVDLEISILSKSDRERQISWHHLCVNSKKKKWYQCTYLQNTNEVTDMENKIMDNGMGEREIRSLGLTYIHYYI